MSNYEIPNTQITNLQEANEYTKEALKQKVMYSFGMDKWDDISRIKLFGEDNKEVNEYSVQGANRRMFEAILKAYGYNNTYTNAIQELQIIPKKESTEVTKPAVVANKAEAKQVINTDNTATVVRNESKKELYINGKTVYYDMYKDNMYYVKGRVEATNTISNHVKVYYTNPISGKNEAYLIHKNEIIDNQYIPFIRDTDIIKPKNTEYAAYLERGDSTIFKEVYTKNDTQSFIDTHKNGLIVIGTDGCSGCTKLHNELSNNPLSMIPTVFLDTDGVNTMKRNDPYITELMNKTGKMYDAYPIVIAFNNGRYTLINAITRAGINDYYTPIVS